MHGLQVAAERGKKFDTIPFFAAELDPNQEALIEKLLGKDYEVVTAPQRLNKVAWDFVEHCAGRWESGKSMLVCIDKITSGRMWRRVGKTLGCEVSGGKKEAGHIALYHAGGAVVSRAELLASVWGPASTTGPRTVDAHIRALRRKLERAPSAPERIVTVVGRGYRLAR